MTDPGHARLRLLFDEAIELPAAERQAFLDSRCVGDADLVRRLAAMLAAATDERFLGNPDGVPGPTPGAAPAPVGEAPGTRIGPYQLLQQIGEGGFGVVFLAEQEQPVARRVALKIIKLGMDTRQVVARFEQERQALALMDHPNIARVLDAGATATGRPYFVMDLVKGVPIVEYCDRNSLTIAERLDLFAQVCSAVQHAHGKGIIHRDLKPSNILVGAQDGRPMPKIIDFGIAKATSQKLTEKTLFTEHRQVIGTLQYMSPEQAEGSLDIDTRTDVYSLGILLYELLTGGTPFDTKALHDAMLGEVQRMIRDVEPPRPSTRISESRQTLDDIAARRRIEPRRLGPLLRGELDWIVMKALEKDRTRRYETASDFALDIRRYLAGDAVVAAPPSASYRLRKFVQRNRVLVSAAAAVAVALLLGVVGTTVGMVRAREETQRAEQAKADETRARTRAETISEFVTTALQAGDATNAGGGQDTTILAAMDQAIADIDAGRFRGDPETEAALRNTIATILRNNGRLDEAYALAVQALAQYQVLFPGDHPTVAASLNDVAKAESALGRQVAAEARMVQSLEMYQRLFEGDHNSVAALLNNVGELRVALGRAAEAEPLLVQALAMNQRLFPGDHHYVAGCLDNLASAQSALGRHEEAEPLMHQALEMRRRLYGGDHPDLAVGINNLAVIRTHLERHKEAEALFAEALAMRQRLFQGDHPAVAEALTNLAAGRAASGGAAEAEPLLVEALAMNRRLYPGDHHAVAHALFVLGSTRLALGMMAEAEPVCLEAVEMHRRLFKGDNIRTALSLGKLARVRHALHQDVQARQAFDENVAMLRRLPGGEGELLGALWRSGSARLDLGDAASALPELEELVSSATARLAADNPWLATYRETLAKCRAALEAGTRK